MNLLYITDPDDIKGKQMIFVLIEKNERKKREDVNKLVRTML